MQKVHFVDGRFVCISMTGFELHREDFYLPSEKIIIIQISIVCNPSKRFCSYLKK